MECPLCHRPGEGDLCNDCGLYLVIPDPAPPRLPEITCGDHIARVWDASVEAATGRQAPSTLATPVAALRGLLQEGLAETSDPMLIAPTQALLGALTKVGQFCQSRSVIELNAAWVELIPAAVAFRQALDLEEPLPEAPENPFVEDRVASFDNPDD
ncbi:MAG: hypothetical protein ACYCW6_25180 [Candidatus Xenobia bacterium]